MLYSATTKGFYISGVHPVIPLDAVEVTEEAHTALMSGQAAGYEIVAGNNGYPTLVIPQPPALSDVQEARIKEAYTESQRRFALSSVTVTVNGAPRVYGCDPDTREHIVAINNLIARSPALVPNPRPFTPQGGSPVMTTHDEFLAIMAAGLAEGQVYYEHYYAHKVAILALTDSAAVLAYDLSTGWPT